jgi:hypothetical protein
MGIFASVKLTQFRLATRLNHPVPEGLNPNAPPGVEMNWLNLHLLQYIIDMNRRLPPRDLHDCRIRLDGELGAFRRCRRSHARVSLQASLRKLQVRRLAALAHPMGP